MYATESGVFFADKIVKENNEYISEYREQLFLITQLCATIR